MKLFGGIVHNGYITQFIILLAGCFILSTGIAWGVKADIVMNPGEDIVKVIAGKLHYPFGWTKLGFDISLVIISCVLSLIFTDRIIGLREGTIVAALIVGPLEKATFPWWNFLDRFIKQS